MNKRTNFNEEESTRQIKLGALVSYIGIFVNILAGILFTPWIIKQIGQSNFGLYTLATSLISMFLLDFGLSAAVSRFVSKYLAEGKQSRVNNILGMVYKLYLLIDIVLLLILLIVYFNLDIIYKELTPDELSRFKIVYLIVSVFSIFSFPFLILNGILTSYEKFVYLKLCDIFNRIFSLVLIMLALINGYGLYALVTLNAISGIITILLKIIIIRRQTTLRVNYRFHNKKILKEIFSFSVWSTIVTISQRFIFNITPSILGAVSGASVIAIFGIASVIEGYVYTIANAINGLFLPKVTRILKKENSDSQLLNLKIKIGRIQLYIIGLVFAGFLTIGKDFIILWVGEEYLVSFYCAVVLIFPSLIYLPQQLGNTILVALNKIKLQAYVFIVMAAINIFLSLFFSRFWGAFGASLAICISYLFRSIGMNIIYYRIVKIDIWKFFRECHLKLAIPILIALVIGVGINNFFEIITWINLLKKGIYLIIIYFLIMWFYSFNEYEKELLKNLITKILKR